MRRFSASLSAATSTVNPFLYRTFCSSRSSRKVSLAQLPLMLDIQLGIVVRTCSGSLVVPVRTGTFLCVSALKVSVLFPLCLRHLGGRAVRTSRGLNEGWVCAQEQIQSAAGVDARWQRLFDEHGDEFTGLFACAMALHG